MTTIKVRQLTKPTADDIDNVTKVIAEATKHDEFVEACIGGDQKFAFPFHRATVASAAIGGEIYVASYGDQDFAGVTLWFGPGSDLLGTPEQGEAGFNTLFESFPEELTTWWTSYFMPKYDTFATAGFGDGTKLASWHLQWICVLPELQRKGIGRALIQAVESKAEAAGIATCLEAENEKNAALYQRWGYSVKALDQFEGSPGFPMYAMMKRGK